MGKTILIVDDFESSRKILSRTLQEAGYNVLQGDSGDQALKELDGRRIDLIITDLHMPTMDGIDLIKNIRRSIGYRFTPVILLTTNNNSEKIQKAKDAGATAFMEKPFKVPLLLDNVKKMIR